MKVWVYAVILLVLISTYFLVNSDKFYVLLEKFSKASLTREVTFVLTPDGRIVNRDSKGFNIKDSLIEVRQIKSPELTPKEALMIEKVVLNDVEIGSGAEMDGDYKQLLLKSLVREGWDDDIIERIGFYLNDPRAVFSSKVLSKNTTHVETKEQYAHNLTTGSLEMCLNFWKLNGRRIEETVKTYNVPSELIVSILKVESNFGTHKGKEAVFNVFWNLSLADHPLILKEALIEERSAANNQLSRLRKRAKWGRSQLHELISLVTDHGDESLLWSRSSWAGAFGLPQFIPTSYRVYARDGNGDGEIDLDNVSDATASIANYLVSNGWKTIANRARKGKVIMRYNNSKHYADCVLDLADLIGERIRD